MTGWNDKFSIVPSIDQQHKYLFTIINNLDSAVKNGHSRIVTPTALKQIIDYTSYHFEYEEKLMEDAKYEYLEFHKELHKGLVVALKGYQDLFNVGQGNITELMDFLNTWLKKHILIEDYGYKETVNKAGFK